MRFWIFRRSSGSVTSVQSSSFVLDDDEEDLEDRSLSFLDDDPETFLDDRGDILLDDVSRSVSEPDCTVVTLDFFLPLSRCLEDEAEDADVLLL